MIDYKKGIAMNRNVQNISLFALLLSISLPTFATHYINRTEKTIFVTNVTAKKRSGATWRKKHHVQQQDIAPVYVLTLEPDQEGDLDNRQGDEVTITSPGMSDKRKLFPTNNAFNYVITLNKFPNKFEQFDINHSGDEDEAKSTKKSKKAKKIKVTQDK